MPAARKPQSPKERPQLLVPRAELDRQLAERIDLGKTLLEIEMISRATYQQVREDYRLWDEYNATLIESALSTSEEATTYEWWGIGVWTDDLQQQIKNLTRDLEERVRRLKSLRGRLGLFAEASMLRA